MKSRNTGLVLSYGYFILNTIISIFMSAFVVRMIGKTDYGIYQSVAAFVTYLTILEFGTGRIMSRNLSLLNKDGSDDNDIKKNISTVLILNCALMLVILIVAVLFWLLIDKLYQNSMTPDQIALAKKIFVFPIISLLISFFQQMFNGILLGYENYTFEKLLSIIKLILRSVIIVAVLSINTSIYLYVIVDTSISVLMFLITVGYVLFKMRVPIRFNAFDREIFRIILPLCFAMLLQSLVTTMNGTLDKFLISVMMTPEDVAVYAIAMTIFSMFSTVACLPMGMFMPKVASDMKRGLEGQALTETLIQPCRLNVIITGVIAFGFAVAGKQFISILYGVDFLPAWDCAMVVVFPMFLNTANDVVINVLDILRKRHVRSMILMITTALNFVLTYFGIKYIGMFGAALATGIATLLQVIILNVYYQTKIRINILYLFKKSFSGIIPCMIASAAICIPIYYYVDNAIASFLSCGCAFLVSFALLSYAFGANSYEKEYIRKTIKKIKR